MDAPSKEKTNISRRTFLRGSAALVGGACVGGLPVAGSAHVAGSDTLRLALVGCGGRGTGAAVQALRTEGPVELVAMADVFQSQIDTSYENLMQVEDVAASVSVPEEHRFVGFDAYEKAIALADVVILATPPAFRPQHFEAAVAAGTHVFMEKPLSSDAPGIRRLLRAGEHAQQRGLSVVVGLQYRYDDAYRALVERISEGMIGEVLTAKCEYLIGGLTLHPRKPGQSELEFQMSNWHFFTWLWAGAPAGLTIHYTDIVNWVKGTHPVRAHGVGGRAALHSPDHGDIYDHFYVEYEYEDGTKLHSETRHIEDCWRRTGVSFQGTHGTAALDTGVRKRDGEVLWRYRKEDAPNPYQREHDVLFASIRKGEPVNDTGWGAMSSMTSILGRMAAHSGQVIEWEDAIRSDLQLVPDDLAWGSTPPVVPDEDGRYPVPVPGKARVL